MRGHTFLMTVLSVIALSACNANGTSNGTTRVPATLGDAANGAAACAWQATRGQRFGDQDRGAPQPGVERTGLILTKACYGEQEAADACRAEFGHNARIADWTQVKSAWRQDRSLENALGLAHENYAWLVLRGSRKSTDNRFYFISRSDGQVEPNFLVHDRLPGNPLVVGSWRGFKLPVLCAL